MRKKNIYPQESVCTSANNITCFNTENMLADKYLKNDILNNRYNDNILKNMKEHQTELSYDANKRNQKNIHTKYTNDKCDHININNMKNNFMSSSNIPYYKNTKFYFEPKNHIQHNVLQNHNMTNDMNTQKNKIPKEHIPMNKPTYQPYINILNEKQNETNSNKDLLNYNKNKLELLYNLYLQHNRLKEQLHADSQKQNEHHSIENDVLENYYKILYRNVQSGNMSGRGFFPKLSCEKKNNNDDAEEYYDNNYYADVQKKLFYPIQKNTNLHPERKIIKKRRII